MLFNSLAFGVFALLFFAFLPLVKRAATATPRYVYITIASFVFYGWWDWRYLILILLSGFVDFFVAQGIYRFPAHKRAFLVASIIANLAILFAFKYLIWLLSNLELATFALLDVHLELTAQIPAFMWVLPVGISFYTFQSMSYTIDVYRGQLRPTTNVALFFSYLSMFPQLVAGPIVRAADVFDDLQKPKPMDTERFFDGLQFVAKGLFKKVVIADTLAPIVDAGFTSAPGAHGLLYWWVITAAFAVQIYCDFSGYSDIAIGLAKWMGIDFKLNFNHPYISTSIREFWQRWHISLSTWFRDYVYIPLGGSRGSEWRRHVNTWITMIVSGLWHGAAWTFVVWGALHALYSSVQTISNRYTRIRWEGPILSFLSFSLTMGCVMIAWVFFRAESISQAVGIVSVMLDPRRIYPDELYYLLAPLCLIGFVAAREAFVACEQKLGWRFDILAKEPVRAAYISCLLCTMLVYRGPGNAFIYFQF